MYGVQYPWRLDSGEVSLPRQPPPRLNILEAKAENKQHRSGRKSYSTVRYSTEYQMFGWRGRAKFCQRRSPQRDNVKMPMEIKKVPGDA